MIKSILPFLVTVLIINCNILIAADGNSEATAKSIAIEQKKIELLQERLKKFEEFKEKSGKNKPDLIDSTKVNIWYELHDIFLKNNSGTAMYYAKQSLSLSQQIAYKKGIANGFAATGFIDAYYEGNVQQGLEKCKIALKMRGEIGDKEGVAKSLTDIALIYTLIPNYPEALKNFFSALKPIEDSKNKRQLANVYQNIGDVYSRMGDNQSAREYYFKAKKIFESMKDIRALSNNLSMIAMTYANQQQFPEAIKHYIAALTLTKKVGDKCEISKSYKNLGNTYSAGGKYPEALQSLNQAVKYSEGSGDDNCIADASLSLGKFNKDRGNLQSAMPQFRKGLSRALDGGSRELVSEGRKGLSDIHTQLKISDNEELISRALKFENDAESHQKSTMTGTKYSPGPKRGLSQGSVRNSDGRRSEEQDYGYILYIVGALITAIGIVSLFNKRKKVAKKPVIVVNQKKESDAISSKSSSAKANEVQKPDGNMDEIRFDDVTVILIDSDLFTANNKELPPKEMVDEMNECFARFDEIMAKYGIEKIEKLGNIYTTDSGLPISDKEKAETIANAAIEIRDFMKLRKENLEEKTFEVSICINCGDAIARIVGVKKITYDIWGAIVNIAARMEKSTETGKIYITDSTYEFIKDTFTCEFYQEVAIKDNKKLKMYFVVNPTPKYTSDIEVEAQ